MDKDKIEIQNQWNKDPCGAITVTDIPAETLEYYRAVRDFRYNEYGPWFDEQIQFSKWRNLDILEIGVGIGSDHFRFAEHGRRHLINAEAG